MPKTGKSSSPTITKPRTAGIHPTTEEIALRAYQIFFGARWCARKCARGLDPR